MLYDAIEWAEDLSPEEVWHDMLLWAPKVRAMVRPQRQLPRLIEELQYSTPNGALLVQLATLWAMVPESIEDMALRENLRWLKAAVEDTDLYAEFVMRVGDYEDQQVLMGKKVNLMEYRLELNEKADDGIDPQLLMGEWVNEALGMGSDCAQRNMVAFTSVNVNHNHAFDAQEKVLIDGIKALREGRQVVLFQYVKQDNQNSQVFSGPVTNSNFR